MKKCKYCKSEIDKKAKICPNCQKKQGVNKVVLIIVIILLIGLIAAIAQGASSSSKKETKKVNIGEKVTVNDVDYTVDEKQIQKEISSGNGYLKYTADGNYLLIKVTVTNNSKEAINIDSSDFVLKDENNARYRSSILVSVDNMDMFNFENINPNATESGYIAYDIANTDLKYTLTINGDNWLDYAGIEVQIQ